jgi:hypothetical protein
MLTRAGRVATNVPSRGKALMRIPPYWVKETYTGQDSTGREHTFHAWGWSLADPDEARQQAATKAKRNFDRYTGGHPLDRYEYARGPLREEIIDTLRDGPEEIAVITRNRYGALILNTASVCFVDVDCPRPQRRGLLDSLLTALFKKQGQPNTEPSIDATQERVRTWARQNPNRAFRLYRTLAGYRLLFTDRLYEPTSPETTRMLEELGSDALYLRLTQQQECFRARLTPKPWRCGFHAPRVPYPWQDAAAEKDYHAWKEQYERKSVGYATCRLVEKFGSGDDTLTGSDSLTGSIVAIHDRFACATVDAPLA